MPSSIVLSDVSFAWPDGTVVFDHLDQAHSLVGPEPDQQVADEMHRAWVDFATTGDPGWSSTGTESDNRRLRRFGF